MLAYTLPVGRDTPPSSLPRCTRTRARVHVRGPKHVTSPPGSPRGTRLGRHSRSRHCQPAYYRGKKGGRVAYRRRGRQQPTWQTSTDDGSFQRSRNSLALHTAFHRQAPRKTPARCSPSVPTAATPSRCARDSFPVNPRILHLCAKQHLVAENSGHHGDLSWCL